MIIIKTLRQTCWACPSQWEGTTTTGQDIYIRYRWGQLFVGVGNTMSEAVFSSFGSSGRTIFSDAVGDGLDGAMTLEEVIRHTEEVIDWSIIRGE